MSYQTHLIAWVVLAANAIIYQRRLQTTEATCIARRFAAFEETTTARLDWILPLHRWIVFILDWHEPGWWFV